jgi:hypothetical protein
VGGQQETGKWLSDCRLWGHTEDLLRTSIPALDHPSGGETKNGVRRAANDLSDLFEFFTSAKKLFFIETPLFYREHSEENLVMRGACMVDSSIDQDRYVRTVSMLEVERYLRKRST